MLERQDGNVIKKTVRTIDNIIIAGILLLALALMLPRLFGYDIRAVETGSMEPTIPTGSICYVNTKIDPAQLRKGDIIAFTLPQGMNVTHRVISINADGSFVTKGDANENADAGYIAQEQVLGKTQFHIPHIGALLNRFNTTQFIIFAVLFLISREILLLLFEDDENKKGGTYEKKKH